MCARAQCCLKERQTGRVLQQTKTTLPQVKRRTGLHCVWLCSRQLRQGGTSQCRRKWEVGVRHIGRVHGQYSLPLAFKHTHTHTHTHIEKEKKKRERERKRWCVYNVFLFTAGRFNQYQTMQSAFICSVFAPSPISSFSVSNTNAGIAAKVARLGEAGVCSSLMSRACRSVSLSSAGFSLRLSAVRTLQSGVVLSTEHTHTRPVTVCPPLIKSGEREYVTPK